MVRLVSALVVAILLAGPAWAGPKPGEKKAAKPSVQSCDACPLHAKAGAAAEASCPLAKKAGAKAEASCPLARKAGAKAEADCPLAKNPKATKAAKDMQANLDKAKPTCPMGGGYELKTKADKEHPAAITVKGKTYYVCSHCAKALKEAKAAKTKAAAKP